MQSYIWVVVFFNKKGKEKHGEVYFPDLLLQSGTLLIYTISKIHGDRVF